MLHAVIMAGGVGARFWPESRRKRPKQVIDLFGEGPMIQQTIDRIESLIPPERRWVVTNREQMALIREVSPSIAERNFIFDAMGRNTAPAIGLAAVRLLHRDPDAVMLVFPADHRIQNIAEFCAVLNTAASLVDSSDYLVTIGIQPTRPETGYGYIQVDYSAGPIVDQVFKVKTFAEKPNLPTAKMFLESGEFLWNSGIFVWRADAIMRQIAEHLPQWYSGLQEIAAHIDTDREEQMTWEIFSALKGISIDYGVMERAPRVAVCRGTFGWSDVGSWDEVWRLMPHDPQDNALRGEATCVDARQNLVLSRDRMIVLVGVEKMVVVDSGDAILICPREASQQVRDAVDALVKAGKDDYI
ncbi:mannose-1-phosphate guanylyltransferase [candidate division KSB1 bacterium]|nr:mannose-1-phosphate guanylyltransferase [candidate division KSB1 bacterium]